MRAAMARLGIVPRGWRWTSVSQVGPYAKARPGNGDLGERAALKMSTFPLKNSSFRGFSRAFSGRIGREFASEFSPVARVVGDWKVVRAVRCGRKPGTRSQAISCSLAIRYVDSCRGCPPCVRHPPRPARKPSRKVLCDNDLGAGRSSALNKSGPIEARCHGDPDDRLRRLD